MKKIWVVVQYESRTKPHVIIGVYSSKIKANKILHDDPNWRSIESYYLR
jgi:hypothetical protein